MSNVTRVTDTHGATIAIRTDDVVYVSCAGRAVRVHFRHGAPVMITFDEDELARRLVTKLADGMEAS